MSARLLREGIVYSKYAHNIQGTGRRETWSEAVDRMIGMHVDKFIPYKDPRIVELLEDISGSIKRYEIMPSMRALQNGGKGIERKHSRMYNCAFTHIDRPRALLEMFFMLLSGCGTGFSVQEHHVNSLPKIIQPSSESIIWRIEDSIEGWAYALGALLASFNLVGSDVIIDADEQLFPLRGKTVQFDYSRIRPKGSTLSSSNGLAPGPDGLRTALDLIRGLLQNVKTERQLTSVELCDVALIASDAVMSGGVRRSASIALFSAWDEGMLNYKTSHDWYVTHPWRARANISALLLRNKDEQYIPHIKELSKAWGEPGVVWTNSREMGTNPCVPGYVRLLTPDGWKKMEDIQVGDRVWGPDGWTNVVRKMNNGTKEVFRYVTTYGTLDLTDNHRIVNRQGIKQAVRNANDVQTIKAPLDSITGHLARLVMSGLALGDGYWHEASRRPFLCIGENDHDYFVSEVGCDISSRTGAKGTAYRIRTDIQKSELPLLPNRRIPDRLRDLPQLETASLLRGLYSANGSVLEKYGRITFKSTSEKMIRDVQLALISLGIKSYVTTNRPKRIKFDNGEYLCKKSYDLNISSDRDIFASKVGFLQEYKQRKLRSILERPSKQTSFAKIKDFSSLGEMPVYDITVDNTSHTYMVEGGYHISNCGEIGLYPKHPITGASGWQVCNLTSINLTSCTDEDDFLERCHLAAALGTIQASYTNLDFLGDTTKDIIREEALIGVSMTGVFDRLEFINNPKLLQQGARVVKNTNEAVANMIGINPSARCTTIKPEGTASLVCLSSSGIHPRHSPEYLRRATYGEGEPMLDILLRDAPELLEKVYYPSANGPVFNGYRFVTLIESPNKDVTEQTVKALETLEVVKTFKKYWVDEGTNLPRCANKTVRHNVSNTIKLDPEEFDSVFDEILAQKDLFNGISVLAKTGDLDYIACPHTHIYPCGDIHPLVREAFEANDYWKVEDEIISKTNLDKLELRKQYNKLWADRCKSFSKEVTWSLEQDVAVNHNETIACAGGACELF